MIFRTIWPDFFRERTYSIFGDQDAGVFGFRSHISPVIFNAGHVYLKIQVTNFKIKEVTTNPKLPTLNENLIFRKP